MDNYEEWKEEYYKKEKVDLKNYCSTNDFEVMKKLGVKVLNKIYTENEFEVLYSNILSFYNEESENKDDALGNLGVGQEEYEELLEKLDKINEEYDF